MRFRLLFLVLSFFVKANTFAQCAMCKAVVEADLKEGGTAGAGLNNGILFLMAIPYLAIVVFGVFYYLQKNKKNSQA